MKENIEFSYLLFTDGVYLKNELVFLYFLFFFSLLLKIYRSCTMYIVHILYKRIYYIYNFFFFTLSFHVCTYCCVAVVVVQMLNIYYQIHLLKYIFYRNTKGKRRVKKKVSLTVYNIEYRYTRVPYICLQKKKVQKKNMFF